MCLHVSKSFADIAIEITILLEIREIVDFELLENLTHFVLLL